MARRSASGPPDEGPTGTPAAPPGRRGPLHEPLVWLLCLTGLALLLVVLREVRWGLAVLTVAVAAAAVLRATLPPRTVGLLAVRGRAADVAVLATLAGGLALLLSVLPSHGRA